MAMATAVFENLNAIVCCRDSEDRAHLGKVKTTMQTLVQKKTGQTFRSFMPCATLYYKASFPTRDYL